MTDRRPLFSASARAKLTRAEKIGGWIAGGVELIKLVVQAVRERKKPPRADEIFKDPLGVEAVREHGQMSVGHPERTDVP